MAITPGDYSYRQLITGTSPSSSNTNQRLLIDENSVDSTFFDAVQDGGGDIRVCEDSAGLNQLPLDVVYCETTGNTLQIFTNKPSYTSSLRGVYVFCGTTTTDTQPAPSSTFGKQNVVPDSFNNYHLESTGTQSDTTGNQDITQSGTGSVVSGAIGDGINCNGSAYWSAASNTRGNDSTTVSFWIKAPVSLSGNSWIYDDGDGTDGGIQVFLVSSGVIRCRVDDSGSNGGVVDTVSTLNDNAWHKVDCVVDKSSNVSFYVDGSAEGSTLNISSYGNISPTENFKVAERVDFATSDPFLGSIDEFDLYSGVKDSSYIDIEYLNQSDPSTFWTQSTPDDPSGGGGSISVTGETTSYTYSAISGDVDLTGEILVTGLTPSYSYLSVDGNVDLTGEVIITGQTPSYSYLAQSGIVELGAVINVVGQTPSYTYSPVSGQVVLAGTIEITGATPSYTYTAISASVQVGELDFPVNFSGTIKKQEFIGTIQQSSFSGTIKQSSFSGVRK